MGTPLDFCLTSWRQCLIQLGITLVLAAALRSAATTCFPAPAGLVGWWSGDGNANDIAGANNGALLGSATITNAGMVGAAFSFDGTNGLVAIPDSPDLRPTNLTLEAWVLFSSLDSAGNSAAGDQYLVFKQNSSTNWSGGSFEGFVLMKVRQANGDTFQFQISNPNGQTITVGSLTTLSTGVWYHVAGVRGPNFAALYVNGQQEGWTIVNFAQDYGNWPLYFGSTGQSAWEHKLAGLLDEVSLYHRALSSDEISGIYAAGAAGKCKGVEITVQPQSQTVPAGSDVVLSVRASGFGLLSYQWQFNGLAIGGAVSSNLLLTSVQGPQVGNYSVVVTNTLGTATSQVAVLTVLLPDLMPLIGPTPTHLTGSPYPQLKLTWGVTNQGPGPVAANLSWLDAVYCSTNPLLDSSALRLSGQPEVGPLAVGGSYGQTNTQNAITLAWDPPALNNLAGYRLYQGATSRVYDQVLDVGLSLTNRVSGFLPGTTYFFAVTAYDANGLETPFSNELRFSAPDGLFTPLTQSGTYYLIFRTDVRNAVSESNKSNNTAVVPITFSVLPPDLAPLALLAPSLSVGPPNPVLSLVWGVTNQGLGPTEWSWSDRVYLSTNQVLDSSALPLLSTYEQFPLPPGGTYWRTNSVALPVVQSGTYYLIFQTDAYSQLADSNYGNNTLSVPVSLTVQGPDLLPLAFAVPSVVTGPPNPRMLLSWGVTNQGAGPAVPLPFWTDRIYFSTNPVIQPGEVPQLNSYESSVVSSGGSYWRTNLARLPVVHSGTYYFIFQTDADNRLYESNPANNTLVVPVVFNVTPPDLAPLQLQVPGAITGPPNPSVTLSYLVTNQGIGPAMGGDYWYDQLYVSTKSVLDGTEQAIVPAGGWAETGPVAGGDSYARTRTVHVPVFNSGVYYLIFKADAQDSLYESNETNNVMSVPVSFNVQPADLAPIALSAPGLITGPPFPIVSVSWGVTNQGSGPVLADETWPDRIFLSSVPQLDSTATLISEFEEIGPLSPGASYWRTNLLRLPVVESGVFYLIFEADAQNAVYESVLTNNTMAVPLTLTINPPDLVPIALEAPGTFSGPPNPVISFVWGVTNAGSGPAVPYPAWSDQLFFSTNPVVYWWDMPILSLSETGVVAAAGSYWRTNTAQVPVVQSGTYYFIFQTDVNDPLLESNPSNNTVVVPVTMTINPPDLIATSFLVPSLVTGTNPTLTVVWRVSNQGTGPALGSWTDSLFLSSSSVLSSAALPFITVAQTNSLPVGADYWITNTLAVPGRQTGAYYFILLVNSQSNLFESTWANNLSAVAVQFDVGLTTPLYIVDSQFLTNGSFQIVASGDAGPLYDLQASTNILEWVSLQSFFCLGAPAYLQDPYATNFDRRFYRILAPSITAP